MEPKTRNRLIILWIIMCNAYVLYVLHKWNIDIMYYSKLKKHSRFFKTNRVIMLIWMCVLVLIWWLLFGITWINWKSNKLGTVIAACIIGFFAILQTYGWIRVLLKYNLKHVWMDINSYRALKASAWIFLIVLFVGLLVGPEENAIRTWGFHSITGRGLDPNASYEEEF